MRLGIDDVTLLLLIPAHCAEVVAVADAWRGREVVVRRRRSALPFKACTAPWIRRSLLTREERVNQVDRGDQEAEGHDVRAAGRDVVIDLELRLIHVVAARHALRAQHELGEEGHVEANEDESASDLAPELVVHDAEHLRPPVVQAADHRDQRRAHHHVVEVRDDEVRVVQVDVGRKNGERDTRQATDREEEHERQRVEHRRVERDRALVERGEPVEDLDGRRNGDREGDRREEHVHERRLTAGEHVVSPHEEAEDRDGDRAKRDEAVAEDVTVAMHRDQFADDAHAREDHDVDRRVRVEPEEVLEEHGVATHRRIEDADVERALNHEQRHGDAEHWRRENLNERGRVERPEEERHTEPRHARRTQLVDRHDEIDAGEDRREAENEDADEHWNRAARAVLSRVRRVERPTRVEATRHQRVDRAGCADHPEVEAEEVHAWEGNVLRSEHDRQDEVSECRWNRWNDHQEHHDRAVQRERLVVFVGSHPLDFAREEQLRSHEQRHHAADKEAAEHGEEIHHADSLMVEREDPRKETAGEGEVVVLHFGNDWS